MAATQAELVQRSLAWLAENGVREICIAAGARNAPLIGALSQSSGVTLRHFFEERSAGFFALGRIMATRRPVALITTSGTAAAELLPAMIEAHYQGLPLIALTADRPKSHRGTGAPQAIEQAALFGSYAALALDADQASPAHLWESSVPPCQPIHLNLCLDEPLDPSIPGIDFVPIPIADTCTPIPEFDLAEISSWLDRQTNTLVAVAGLHPDEASRLAPLLASLGLPVFAEATANLRPHGDLSKLLVPPTEASLTTLAPTAILRFGAVPSGRWWRDLEARPEIAVLNLTRTGHPGLARRENVHSVIFDIATLRPLNATLAQTTVRLAIPSFSNPIENQAEPNEKAWLLEVAAVIPDDALVFLGNSLPIREWNETVGSTRPFRTFANRGANGIDGLVSTFLGLSAEESGAESWLILGDLSALYDLAAPWILSQLPSANRRILVLNNGGGRIFAQVPSLSGLNDTTRTMIENRHHLSFRPWADLWSIPHRFIQNPADLQGLPSGPLILEIPTEP